MPSGRINWDLRVLSPAECCLLAWGIPLHMEATNQARRRCARFSTTTDLPSNSTKMKSVCPNLGQAISPHTQKFRHPLRPSYRSDLTQRASTKPGAIQNHLGIDRLNCFFRRLHLPGRRTKSGVHPQTQEPWISSLQDVESGGRQLLLRAYWGNWLAYSC